MTQTNRPRRLDTNVEYVDPAVVLPAGASARVGVTLAGTEAVRVGRELRLPETWLLRDTNRGSTHGLIALVAALGLVGLFLALVLRGMRAAEPQEPVAVDRRVAVAIAVSVALLTLGRTLLGLPERFAAWDTTDPWSSFVTTLAIGSVLGAVLMGAATSGAWAVADALRRRVGVPLLPAARDEVPDASQTAPAIAAARVRDGVLLGAALGTALPALAGLGDFVRTATGTPPAPSTALGAALPWALAAVGTVTAAISVPPLAAFPALAVAAGARTTRGRWLVLAVAALLSALGAQVAAEATLGAATVAFGAIAGVALVAGVIWLFGRAAVLPWLAAGPAAALVAGLRTARTAVNPTDRSVALVTVAVAAALLLVLYRGARRAAVQQLQTTHAAA